MFRCSLALFGLGLALLTLAIVAGQQVAHDGSVPGQILTEGLTVAAWVSLWQALANLLIEWQPHCRELIAYRRIVAAPVQFQQVGEECFFGFGLLLYSCLGSVCGFAWSSLTCMIPVVFCPVVFVGGCLAGVGSGAIIYLVTKTTFRSGKENDNETARW